LGLKYAWRIKFFQNVRERERERERRYSNPLSKENEHDAKLWSSSFVLIHYLRKLSTWVPKSG
jgi:hypothetical protein